jgi:hypothetical protein
MSDIYVRVEDLSAVVVSKMISHRTKRIEKYTKKLRAAVVKLYDSEGNPSKAVCDDVRNNVDRIQEMIVRNSDDASNLEAIIIEWKHREIEKSEHTPYIY